MKSCHFIERNIYYQTHSNFNISISPWLLPVPTCYIQGCSYIFWMPLRAGFRVSKTFKATFFVNLPKTTKTLSKTFHWILNIYMHFRRTLDRCVVEYWSLTQFKPLLVITKFFGFFFFFKLEIAFYYFRPSMYVWCFRQLRSSTSVNAGTVKCTVSHRRTRFCSWNRIISFGVPVTFFIL